MPERNGGPLDQGPTRDGLIHADPQVRPGVPIAAGENHFTRFEFARLLEDRAVEVWQPDLSKTGGITEVLRIAAMASAFGLTIHPHSSATTINHTATLHVLAAIGNGGYFEACVSAFNRLRDLFEPNWSVDDQGSVEPPTGPGLGIEVDIRALERFPAIDGPGYLT